MSATTTGALIIVGGSEDKVGERAILKTVAAATAAPGSEPRIVVITTATQFPEASAAAYRAVFASLGVAHVDHLDLRTRDQAYDPAALDLLAGAPLVFFTGGNQLRITTHLGGTPVSQRLHELYANGGTLAGTSAGAVALGEHMPYERLDSSTGMAAPASFCVLAGLAFLPNTLIDSHFSQRHRMWRLHAALALHGETLALGIDEDTAIHVAANHSFSVLGRGAVYVVENASPHAEHPSGETAIAAFAQPFHRVRERALHPGDTFQPDAQRQPAAARVTSAGSSAQ